MVALIMAEGTVTERVCHPIIVVKSNLKNQRKGKHYKERQREQARLRFRVRPRETITKQLINHGMEKYCL